MVRETEWGAENHRISGDLSALRHYLKALPKAELHLHMEGSIRPEMLLQLADRNRLRLPFTQPNECLRFYNYANFSEFAKTLLMGVYCLRQPDDFFDVLFDMATNMNEQNIRYAEITWTPQFYLKLGFPLNEILAAMNAAREQARLRWGLEMRWIPDLVRSHPGPARLISEWATSERAREGGVVALGLGGPEAGHPSSGFASYFQRAASLGLPANPHAGEGMGAQSIRETISHLHPVRIGHGVRAIEDEQLVKYLAHHAIPLEVCLTSNIRLGVYSSYAEHPVKRLLDAGCTVTLNSDDPVLFQTTLTEEYLHAITDCGLTPNSITKTIIAALQASHLSNDEKQTLSQAFEQRFTELSQPKVDQSVETRAKSLS